MSRGVFVLLFSSLFPQFAFAGGDCTDVKVLWVNENSETSITLIVERDTSYYETIMTKKLDKPARDTVLITQNPKKYETWFDRLLARFFKPAPTDATMESFDKCRKKFREAQSSGKKLCLGYMGAQMEPNEDGIYKAYAIEYVQDISKEFRCYMSLERPSKRR